MIRNFIIKGLLKYVVCLLGITMFLAGETHVSLADSNKDGFFLNGHQKDDDGEGDDDDEDGEDEDEGSHNAGKNCLTSGCHAAGGEKRFYLGGTIYTDADGVAARVGAQVKVVDANGVTVTLTSDPLGNIYSSKGMTSPFTITVSYQGRMVKMLDTASGGGCNADGCHVAGSAGRVYISTKDLDLTGTVTEAQTDGSSEISYDGDIKAILDAKCVTCHKSGGTKSDVPLTTYAEVTASRLVTPGSEDSLLIRKLNKNLSEGTMWTNLNSDSEYEKIKDWIVKYNAQESSPDQGTAGVAVAGARVSLSLKGKIKYKTTTDSTGAFTLKKVKANEYTLKAIKKGYRLHKQSYEMKQKDVAPLEITLEEK